MKEANYPALFEKAAQEFGLPADILKGVAFAETAGRELEEISPEASRRFRALDRTGRGHRRGHRQWGNRLARRPRDRQASGACITTRELTSAGAPSSSRHPDFAPPEVKAGMGMHETGS